VRKAMEAGLAEQAKVFKNFQVRSDSWQDLTLAGSPAVSVVSDYTSGKGPMCRITFGALTRLIPCDSMSICASNLTRSGPR